MGDRRDELIGHAHTMLRQASPPLGRDEEWAVALRRWETLRLDLLARRGTNGPAWSRPLARLIARAIAWWVR